MLSKYARKQAIRHLANHFKDEEWTWLCGQNQFIQNVNKATESGDMGPVMDLGSTLVKTMPQKRLEGFRNPVPV